MFSSDSFWIGTQTSTFSPSMCFSGSRLCSWTSIPATSPAICAGSRYRCCWRCSPSSFGKCQRCWICCCFYRVLSLSPFISIFVSPPRTPSSQTWFPLSATSSYSARSVFPPSPSKCFPSRCSSGTCWIPSTSLTDSLFWESRSFGMRLLWPLSPPSPLSAYPSWNTPVSATPRCLSSCQGSALASAAACAAHRQWGSCRCSGSSQ